MKHGKREAEDPENEGLSYMSLSEGSPPSSSASAGDPESGSDNDVPQPDSRPLAYTMSQETPSSVQSSAFTIEFLDGSDLPTIALEPLIQPIDVPTAADLLQDRSPATGGKQERGYTGGMIAT